MLRKLGARMGFPTGILRTFTAPAMGDWLHVDGVSHSRGHAIHTTADVGEPFSDRDLPSAADGLAWLAYHLPTGHPIQPNLPGIYALIRARLRNPDLLIGSVLLHDEYAPVPAALVAGQRGRDGTWHHVRPAALADRFDPALDLIPPPSAASVRMMLDPEFERLVCNQPRLPVGGYAQNPALTVPHLVDAVRAMFDLDADAATHYLQLLALPNPTDELVRRRRPASVPCVT
jgi:hypothetical protein